MTIEPSMNLMSVLLLIASAQGLFLALALAARSRGKKNANRILAILTATLSIGLLNGFMIESNYYFRVPFLSGAALPLNFILGPLFYSYSTALTSPHAHHLKQRELLHLTPAVVVWVLQLMSVIVSGSVVRGNVQSPSADAPGRSVSLGLTALIHYLRQTPLPYFDVVPLLVVVQMAIYLLLSLRSIRRHSLRVADSCSSVEELSLNWLRNLLIAFFSIWVLFTIHFFVSSVYGFYRETAYLFYLAVAAIIYVLGFKGLKQPDVFARLASVQHASGALFTRKYQKSSLTPELAREIRRSLLSSMEQERPYLEPNLTLPQLAARLSVSTNHLSQVINGELHRSFFDFVNEYRAKEVKRLLLSPDSRRLSILGVAMEAGFNSKSAFYSAFKKHSGMTPSQFIKSVKTSPSL